MARYLITGGAGFIGSHVVDALAARGDAVRVVDDLSTGRRENLAGHPGIELIEADLGGREVAREAVADIDCVIHLAAIPSVPRSVREPRRSHHANVEATHELLLAARDAGVRRVVLASSSSVYGESETLPKHEGLRPAPLSPYALHKLIGEQYAALFTRLYGLETVALRFFNVFGPRQSPQSQYSGVISLFTAALLAGRAPTIHGDGEQTRDFTYVADVARGVLQACEAPAASGRAVNLARGGRMSVNALYAALQRATGVSVAARHAEPRRGDVRHSQAEISLARDLLGFAPVVPVEEGLERTVDWQRQQAEDDRAGTPGARRRRRLSPANGPVTRVPKERPLRGPRVGRPGPVPWRRPPPPSGAARWASRRRSGLSTARRRCARSRTARGARQPRRGVR